jgi:hypothetical protein
LSDAVHTEEFTRIVRELLTVGIVPVVCTQSGFVLVPVELEVVFLNVFVLNKLSNW